MKIAMIGLDTSHSVEFTRIIQGTETPEDKKIKELEIISCLRFPSAFNSEESQDDRQKQLEAWGVNVTRSFEEAVKGAEGIMIEINDPELHLEYFEKSVKLGLPIFLDKPLAGNLEEGQKIVELAKQNSVPFWSSSSLRFTKEVAEAASVIENPVMCNVFGPMGKAPKGSSVVWYGVHAFEMLSALMGHGVKSVFSRKDEKGIVSIVQYKDGRRGIVECNENAYVYGGRLQGDQTEMFQVDSSVGLYINLMHEVKNFFLEGTIPVPVEHTLEIQAMLDAAERSVKSGMEEKV